jgi:TP901 family phage tail tape measure protein
VSVPIAQLFVTVGADITGLSAGLNSASQTITKFGNSLQSAGRDLSVGLTAPVVGAAGVVTKLGSDFEHSMTGVRKTVDGLDANPEAFKALQTGLLDLSTSADAGGKSADQLAHVAEIAGQLGVKSQDILGFTKTIAQLSVTTGIDPAALAEPFARVLALTGVRGEEDIQRFGSVLTTMGNDFEGTEQNILDIATRASGALHALGVSGKDVLAIATAAVSTGLEPEAAGTSLSKTFTEFGQAVAGVGNASPEAQKKIDDLSNRIQNLSGSLQVAQQRQAAFGRNTPAATVAATANEIDKYQRELSAAQAEQAKLANAGDASTKLTALASAAGVSTDQFKKLFKENPAQAFQMVINGLRNIRDTQGPDAFLKTMNDLGITDVRQSQLITGLVERNDQLNKALGEAGTAWDENKATQDEVRKAMEDTDNQFNLLLNKLKRVAIEGWLGLKDKVQAAMKVFDEEVIPKIQGVQKAWDSLSPGQQRTILEFGLLAISIGPVLLAIGTLVTILGSLLNPIALVAILIGLLAIAWDQNWGGIRDKAGAAIVAITKFINGDLGPSLIGAAVIAVIFGTIMTGIFAKMLADWLALAGPWLSNAVKIGIGWLIAFGPAILIAATVVLALILIGIAISNFRRLWDQNWAGMQEPIVGIVESLGNMFDLFSKIPTGFAGLQPQEWKDQADAAKLFVDRVRGGQSAIPQLQGVANTLDTIDAGTQNAINGFPDLQKQIQGTFNQGTVAATPALSTAGVPQSDLLTALQTIQANQAAQAAGANNNVAVTINNPVVPDLATGDAFAKQVQDQIFSVLIASAQGITPPGPAENALPGQDF